MSTPSDTPRHRYDARFANAIETRWQSAWLSNDVFRVPNPGDKDFDASRPKFYCLDMFPYPSGAGLHIGHPEGYTATDIVSRYKRMKGFNVLHPMGWDAFGLPAEQYAIQTGVHPAITTKKAIDNFRRQLQRFGFSYDWSREYGTIDPEYYKWTQWIFLQLYNAWFDESGTQPGTPTLRVGRTTPDSNTTSEIYPTRSVGVPGGVPNPGRACPISDLESEFTNNTRPIRFNPRADEVPESDRAKTFQNWQTLDPQLRRRILDSYRLTYQSTTTVNWCPKLGTVLANDEVIDGKSERGGYPVLRKPLKQWMFRITAYAERLLRQLDDLEWVESTKTMQREWIGKSEGAEIEFEVLGTPTLRVGSTTPDPNTSKEKPPTRSVGVPEGAHNSTLIDSNPKLAQRPLGFIPRDPFPEGIYGASPASAWSRRNLPHVQMPGATYFVSWKCVPDLTLDENDRSTVLNALTHFDDKRCRVYAACVMNNHVHWLVRPFEGVDLHELCESVKHYSATQVNKAHARTGRLWDPEAFDHIVRDGASFSEYAAYIVRNPKEAGVVQDVAEYAWTFVHADAIGGSPHAERGGTQEDTRKTLRVFTTRPDTLFGATYMVVAPEHPLISGYPHAPRGANPENDKTIDDLRAYIAWAKNRSDVERQESKEKTGVFTGLYAINPATNQKIPIWTADYVLMGYGTGAIMAVPGHDERDFEFAKKFHLPVIEVVQANERTSEQANKASKFECFSGDGIAICSSNSEISLNGLPTPEAKQKITTWLEQNQIGHRKINYKLRDWTFSRQRYWGEPFPIVFDNAGNAYPIEPSHLPVKLPELADYAPVESDDPQPLLAKAKDWVRTTAGGAGVSPALLHPSTPVTRETNTMPGSAGSSWYAIRYCDAKNSQRLVGEEAERYWMGTGLGTPMPPGTPTLRVGRTTPDPNTSTEIHPTRSVGVPGGAPNEPGIDLYLGGSEHAVGHLLYSRFWQNVLFDLGHVTCKEPFRKLFHQGLITSFAYQRPDKSIVPVDEVKEVVEGQPEKGYIEIATGKPVSPIITKMSKRYKNVINPDDVINEFGADTCRLYEMYMGPLDASKPWNPRDIVGCFRFLQRAWRMCVDEETGKVKLADSASSPGSESRGTQTEKLLHRLIKKVGDDIERLSFNTAIAAMMEFIGGVGTPTLRVGSEAEGALTRSQMERFILTLAPFAPHLAEEVWHKLGFPAGTRDGGVLSQPWPTFDPAMLVDDEVELPISVMGKVRARITVSTNIAKDPKALEAAAMADCKVQELIAGKEVKKVIVVPGKMVNLVLA